MERIDSAELNEALDKRLRLTAVEITGDARWTIVTLSHGMPYYVEMLANTNRSTALDVNESRLTLMMSSTRWTAESRTAANRSMGATQSNQSDNRFREVLLSCALAQTDGAGFLTATNVIEPLNSILRGESGTPTSTGIYVNSSR